MRTSNERQRAFGFTLIEILISLTILTIVLGAVYSSFFSVQRALDRFDTITLKYHEARTILDIMRREIEGALPDKGQKDDETEIPTAFIMKDRDVFGKNTSVLNFSAFSFKQSGLNRISYFVKEKDGKLSLLKTEAPASRASKAYEAEVIDAIESFTVETLYNKKWVKTWDSSSTGMLPEIVRISMEFDDNGKSVHMTEYARPRTGTQL